jgi:hypothetical protein
MFEEDGYVISLEGEKGSQPSLVLIPVHCRISGSVLSFRWLPPLNARTVDPGAGYGLSFVEFDAVFCLCRVCGHFWSFVLQFRFLMC